MFRLYKFLFFFCLFGHSSVFCQEVLQENPQDRSAEKSETLTKQDTQEFWPAMKTTGRYMLHGAYRQFTAPTGLTYFGTGAAATIYIHQDDKRISDSYRRKELPKIVDNIGDAGVFFNFPITMGLGWYWGRSKQNTRFQYFMIEYAATLYLTLLESGMLSYVQIHRRPSELNLSSWETDFRGNSSWPSGHIVPYSTLFFKTLQYYGPAWSLLPMALTLAASYQRVQDGKHWPSDIVGAFFLSGMSSEGVRIAANHKHNHPFYQWAFEHELHVSILRVEKGWGPVISFAY